MKECNECAKELAYDLEKSIVWDAEKSQTYGFSIINYEETSKRLIALGYTKGED